MKKKSYTHHHAANLDELTKKSYVIYQDFKGAGKLGTYTEDFFAITLFERGEGAHTIDNATFAVKPKQVHVQFPKQKQKWKLGPGAKGQRLVIRKALAETFSHKSRFAFSSYNPYPVLNLDATAYRKIEAEFLALKKEITSKTIFIELVNARCRLISLMISLWIDHKHGESALNTPNSLAHKFHSLVDTHFKTQKSVAFYARHLHVTPNYLGVVCKKQYKMSALAFIQERVLLEAKRLLHSSDKSIKEIAFDLGFKNLSYFSFFFKSKTHLTPKEYKELLDGA